MVKSSILILNSRQIVYLLMDDGWPFVSSRFLESLVLASDLFTMFPSFLKGFPAIGMSGLGPIPGHPATQSWTNTAGWPFIFPGKVSILPGYWSGSDSAWKI